MASCQSADVALTDSGGRAAGELPEGSGRAAGELRESYQGVDGELPDSSDAEVFGVVPSAASHWRLRRKVGEAWVPCEAPAGEAVISEWPLRELSLARVRLTWGPGVYRVTWIDSSSKKRVCGTGKVFALRPPPKPAPAPPAPAAPPAASAPGLGALLPAIGGASPHGLAGAMALLGGGEMGGLAQALLLLQVLHGMSQQQAEALIARERLALERDRERDRERSEEQRAFYQQLAATTSRRSGASEAAAARLSESLEELHARLDGLEEAAAKAGGEGGLTSLIPALLAAVKSKEGAA